MKEEADEKDELKKEIEVIAETKEKEEVVVKADVTAPLVKLL